MTLTFKVKIEADKNPRPPDPPNNNQPTPGKPGSGGGGLGRLGSSDEDGVNDPGNKPPDPNKKPKPPEQKQTYSASEIRVVVMALWLEWEAKEGNPALDENPNWLGGKRIFPDHTSPSDNTPRNQVKLKISGLANVPVYLKSFDVDDPTPSDVDTTGEIDPNGDGGDDNRGSPKTGTLAETELTLDADGNAEVLFTVTLQPGDNFRIAAAYDQDELNEVQSANPGGAGFLPAGDAQSSGVDVFASPMLTVWRKLHVELDSLGPPDPSEIFDGAGVGNDDVDLGDLSEPDIALMQALFPKCFIEVVNDLQAYDNRDNNSFIRNLDEQQENDLASAIRDVASQKEFWVSHIIACYEGGTSWDHDPNSTGYDLGSQDAAAFIFRETIRDVAVCNSGAYPHVTPSNLEVRTTTQEAIHTLGLTDNDPQEGVFSPFVNTFGTDAENDLNSRLIGLIRDRIKQQERPLP